MSGELVQFGFEGNEVRVHVDEEGMVWWSVSDIAKALDIGNAGDVTRRLESNEYRAMDFIDSAGRPNRLTFMNESGLYRAIFRSNKPEAKRLKNWVFGEVLPSIRKTGSYSPTLPAVKNPVTQMAIDTLIRLDEMEQRQLDHEREIAETQRIALELLAAQQYFTIREYVSIHQLTRQLPPGTEQQQYGRWLVGYCKEKGLPLRKMQTEQYQEWAYPARAIQDTLYSWLARRYGQERITNLEIDEDGVSWE